MSPRQPNFDVDRARGEEAERLFRKLRTGILAGSTQVKRDDRAAETGNFYIELECQRVELECQRVGGWMPSGLDDPDSTATAWCIVAWPIVIAMPVWILRQVIKGATPIACTLGSHPTRGVLVPLSELLPLAVAVANAPVERKDAA